MIHASAIIHSSCTIHPSAEIGPYSVIGANVTIGKNTRIGIGCVIGGPPESREFFYKWSHGVTIGEDCFISNLCTVDAGTIRNTMIGNRVTLLRGQHCGHDSAIDDDVILSCNSIVGGFSIIMQGANLGLGSIIHQNMIVPPYAFIGQGGIVTKSSKLEPFGVFVGNPVRFLKINEIGISRSGFGKVRIEELKKHYEDLVAKKTN